MIGEQLKVPIVIFEPIRKPVLFPLDRLPYKVSERSVVHGRSGAGTAIKFSDAEHFAGGIDDVLPEFFF